MLSSSWRFVRIAAVGKHLAIVIVCLVAWFRPAVVIAQNFFTDSSKVLSELESRYYLETFDGWTEGDPLDGHQAEWESPATKDWSWVVSASGQGNHALYSLYHAVSTSSYQDTLTFQLTGGPTYVFAGEFWGTQYDGFPQPTELEIETDTGLLFNQAASGPTFIGIISNEPLSTVTIRTSGVQPAWATARQIAVGDLRGDGDIDGDGMTNGDERFAGTDTTNPNSKLVVSAMGVGVNNVVVRFGAIAGKSYQLE